MEFVNVEFTVNRKREGWDEGQQIVKCVISRPRSVAEKIDYNFEEAYDENAYERFCREVPRIVSAMHGLECGCDWFFEDGPFVK